jgi:uncharacterized protein YbbC (DUF1343 family)
MTVKTGLDVLRDRQFADLRGRRVGLLTNPGAVSRDLVSAYRLITRAPGVDVRALYSPEHGFAGAAPDGEPIGSSRDPRTGLPVYSLYGSTQRPSADMLADIDMLVCDLQDIGVRYYTYAWTVSMAMEAAGAAGIDVLILDRPNPLGGRIDGLPVEAGFTSLVGLHPVPAQHGLTMAELMGLVNARWDPTPASLSVIRCEGWSRTMSWEQTGLPFVPPSPAMPQISTVRQYPGACLIEGTNLSEGRGTALPFEICGAPYIDAEALADALNALELPGVRFRPHHFTPTARKYAGELCHGVQAHIMDASFRPLQAWVAVIHTVRQCCPDAFAWLPPWEGSAHRPFDLLAGGARLRTHIDAGASLGDLTAAWDAAAVEWRYLRRDALLYAGDDKGTNA